MFVKTEAYLRAAAGAVGPVLQSAAAAGSAACLAVETETKSNDTELQV